MKIAVLIKQVPETDNLKLDEKTGTVIRKGVESIVNPLDLYAIETALRIKDNLNNNFVQESERSDKTTVTAITMGPADAERSLREAISMGCDAGILITGREFAGSDTFATSLVISRVVSKALTNLSKTKTSLGKTTPEKPGEEFGGEPNPQNNSTLSPNIPFDLILCGERATDGDTGQVGPAVASFLNLPILTYVSRVEIKEKTAQIDRIVEDGIETYTVELPAVISISKAIGTPRLPTLSGKKRAKRANIKIINFTEELFKRGEVGLKGSPTRVIKIFRPQIKRKPTIITIKKEADIEIAVNKLIDFMANDINLTG